MARFDLTDAEWAVIAPVLSTAPPSNPANAETTLPSQDTMLMN